MQLHLKAYSHRLVSSGLLAGVLLAASSWSMVRAETPCKRDPAACRIQLTKASIRASLLYNTAGSVETYLTGAGKDARRSIPLALGLSAAVPGLGQVYNGQWTKAVIGVALEALVITSWVTIRQNGLDAEDEFRAFALRDWDPLRYAAWLNDYAVFLQEEFGATVTAPPITPAGEVDFQNPNSWSLADQQMAAEMFAQVHAVERQMFHPETGATFTHTLPDFGDQQYYELIGKYFQFAPGWRDYPEWVTEEGRFTPAIDPEMSGSGNTKPNVSANFYKYADDHARAQDLLRRASRISLLLIVNHLVAAVDAAVSAKLHNDRISTSMGFAYSPDGRAVPVATVKVRF